MFFRKIRSRYRRFRHNNKHYHPNVFLTLDLAIMTAKFMFVAGLFAGLFYFLPI